VFSLFSKLITIRSSKFTDNTASSGACIFALGGGILIYDSYFARNTVTRNGGALNLVYSYALITNTTFSANIGESGGALYWEQPLTWTDPDQVSPYGYPSIINCTFQANVATQGGAIWMGQASVTISGSKFTNNVAVTAGAAIYALSSLTFIINSQLKSNTLTGSDLSTGSTGAAVYVKCSRNDNTVALGFQPQLRVTGGSVVSGNSADYGAGIYISECQFLISGGVQFTSNIAAVSGGGMYVLSESAYLTSNDTALLTAQVNSLTPIGIIESSSFTYNSAVCGGGIAALNYHAARVNTSTFTANLGGTLGGAAICLIDTTWKINQNTFIANNATSGGGGNIVLSPSLSFDQHLRLSLVGVAFFDFAFPVLSVAADTIMRQGSNNNQFINNIAGYGSISASRPFALLIETPSPSTKLQISAASLSPPLRVSLRDAFGQLASSYTPSVIVSARPSPADVSPILLGKAFQTLTSGIAKFGSLLSGMLPPILLYVFF
jgi:hypothetical protein